MEAVVMPEKKFQGGGASFAIVLESMTAALARFLF